MNRGRVPIASEPGAWKDQAACKGKPTRWFYMTDDYGPDGNRGRREADLIDWRGKRCCLVCTVKRECLQHALEHHEAGYWGSTTEAQRREIRAQREGAA